MAPKKEAATKVRVPTGASRKAPEPMGSDVSAGATDPGLSDAPRDTPGWVEEAIGWIKAEKLKHEDRTKRHLESASTWAAQGFIAISTNELREATFEAGIAEGLMWAHYRLLEGQQGIR